jgi:hypothetical protein
LTSEKIKSRVVTVTKGEYYMTQREFFENVMTETMNEEVKAFAAEGIAKLDAQAAKRRELAAAKAEEDQKMVDKIVNTILNSVV